MSASEFSNLAGAAIHFLIVLALKANGTSLVAQWLRIRLPRQGTWVRSLVREDPTCHGVKIPRAAEQLSPCATTTEPAL